MAPSMSAPSAPKMKLRIHRGFEVGHRGRGRVADCCRGRVAGGGGVAVRIVNDYGEAVLAGGHLPGGEGVGCALVPEKIWVPASASAASGEPSVRVVGAVHVRVTVAKVCLLRLR